MSAARVAVVINLIFFESAVDIISKMRALPFLSCDTSDR